jgi:hypothetical protein
MNIAANQIEEILETPAEAGEDYDELEFLQNEMNRNTSFLPQQNVDRMIRYLPPLKIAKPTNFERYTKGMLSPVPVGYRPQTMIDRLPELLSQQMNNLLVPVTGGFINPLVIP